jgi:hypothetical protein
MPYDMEYAPEVKASEMPIGQAEFSQGAQPNTIRDTIATEHVLATRAMIDVLRCQAKDLAFREAGKRDAADSV